MGTCNSMAKRDPNKCFYWVGCNDCCTYVPKKICARLEIDPNYDPQCSCNGGCRDFEWDCINAYRPVVGPDYATDIGCEVDDVVFYLENPTSGDYVGSGCFLIFESAYLGHVISGGQDHRVYQSLGPSGDYQCNCHYMEFTFPVDGTALGTCCDQYGPVVKTWRGDDREFSKTLVSRGVCPPLPDNTGVNIECEVECCRDGSWFGTHNFVASGTLPATWIANDDVSKWLIPDCDPLYASGSYEYYTLTWDIPFDPQKINNVVIGGRFAVDNCLDSIVLNGSDTDIQLCADPPVCDDLEDGSEWHYFELPHEFLKQGSNEMVVTISNIKGGCESAGTMGFRCEFMCCIPTVCTIECCQAPPNTGEERMYLTIDDQCEYDAVWEVDGPEASKHPLIPNTINASWLANTADSSWLSFDCESSGVDATDTTRTYSVEWDISERHPEKLHITGRVAVDDAITAIYLNGSGLTIDEAFWFNVNPTPCLDNTYVNSMSEWHAFDLPSQFLVSGINTISFVTENRRGLCSEPGNAGFRAEFSCCECGFEEVPYCFGLRNTGVTYGAKISDPYGECYYDGAWSGDIGIISYNVPINWLMNTGASKWITPFCDGTDWDDADTWRSVRTSFQVLKRPEDIKIIGRYSCDNNISGVLLNGVDTGISFMDLWGCPGSLAGPENWFDLEICDGFILGTNTLEFYVGNVCGCCGPPGSSPGPTGFRCELACTLKDCLWVADETGTSWELYSGECPEFYSCIEPVGSPTGTCDSVRTCCQYDGP